MKELDRFIEDLGSWARRPPRRRAGAVRSHLVARLADPPRARLRRLMTAATLVALAAVGAAVLWRPRPVPPRPTEVVFELSSGSLLVLVAAPEERRRT